MSGGFFRGTSADQDTRFSNKMSKLLKSQKFAPELDVVVEMAKVKIDVIKPWIAIRVTELLGFEDEVLINFIYGLLDVKEADGKHLQIQLTGFMEKNTGRFMKELWGLLTSAQNNLSGVPQQFLDAKAEEAKKKKDEKERTISEAQRMKEEQEKDAELEGQRRLSPRDESYKAKLEENQCTMGSPVQGGDEKLAHNLEDQGAKTVRDARKKSRSTGHSSAPSSSPSRGFPPSRQYRPRSISRSPRRGRQYRSPVRRRSPIQRHSPFPSRLSPRHRQSPSYSRSPLKCRKSPNGLTSPQLWSRSPSRYSRRSPIIFRSPPRRNLGPWSPPVRRRTHSGSLSPAVLRLSPSRSPYIRRRSPSKDQGIRGNKSPLRMSRSFSREQIRCSRSPPKKRSSLNMCQGILQSSSPPRRRYSSSKGQSALQSESPFGRRMSLSGEEAKWQSRSPPRRRGFSSDQVTPHSKSPSRGQKSLTRERSSYHSRSPSRGLKNLSRELANRQSRSSRSPPMLKSLGREQVAGHSRSPYLRKRTFSREQGCQQIRSRSMSHRSLSRERCRRDGFDGRDGNHVDLENECHDGVQRRSGRPDKRHLPDQWLSVNGEGVFHAGKDWSASQPHGSSMAGENLFYRDFDEQSYAETARRDASNSRDTGVTLAFGKNFPGFQGMSTNTNARIDSVQRTHGGKEKQSQEAADSDEDDAQLSRPHSGLREAVGEDDDDESPGSSEGRQAGKKHRKEEKHRKKEEKKKRRVERQRRKEGKRTGSAMNAGVGVDLHADQGNRSLPEVDNYNGQREAVGKADCFRGKGEETEDEQKRIERELRTRALESLRAKKGIAN